MDVSVGHQESRMPKNWCFWTVVWKRLLKVPWTARRSNWSILKEISPEYSLEGLMLKLKLKLRYFSHLMRRTDSSEMFWCWVRLKSGGEVGGGDEMIGWHHRLNGHKFEQAAGVGDGQGSLMCWSPWGRKVSVMIERLKWLTGWSRKWQGWTLTS